MLLKINLAIVILCFYMSAFAGFEELKNKHELTAELDTKYQELNYKIKICRALGKEAGILEINDPWFLSLDQINQQTILMFLDTRASYECYKKEQQEYILAAVNYAIYTNDKTKIENWILLNEISPSQKNLAQRLKKIDVEKLNTFINSQEPSLLFDHRKTWEKYYYKNN